METLWQDVKFGFRVMLKTPLATLAILLTLSVGIASVTVVFSFVNGLLLRPLPFFEPERLVKIWEKQSSLAEMAAASGARSDEELPVAPGDYTDWVELARSFSSLAAVQCKNEPVSLVFQDYAQRVHPQAVTSNFFSTLGVRPLLGRTFTVDDQTGREIVLSYGFWMRDLGGNPDAVGRNVLLNGEDVRIVGVMPPGFQFPAQVIPQVYALNEPVRHLPDLWRPLAWSPEQAHSRGVHSLVVIARLKPGMTVLQARQEMASVASRARERVPAFYDALYRDMHVRVDGLQDAVGRRVRSILAFTTGATLFVLAIGCMNVAALVLSVGAARRKELAVRAALGSSPGRLFRQMLTESILLSALSGVLGVLLVAVVLPAVLAFFPAEWTIPRTVRVDYRVLGFALLVSLLAGIFFGLGPALEAGRINICSRLMTGTSASRTSTGSSRFYHALLVAQLGVAVIILLGVASLFQSFIRLQWTDPGFGVRNRLVVTFQLQEGESTASPQTHEAQTAFFQRLVDESRQLTGVESAGASSTLPFEGLPKSRTFHVEGESTAGDGFEPMCSIFSISPGYLNTLGVPLIHGREFAEGDTRESLAVAVVNEALVRRYLDVADLLKCRIKLGALESDSPWLTIVGICRDVKSDPLSEEAGPEVYLPLTQEPEPSMSLVLRTRTEPRGLTPKLMELVSRLDSSIVPVRVTTLEQLVSDRSALNRFAAVLAGCVGIVVVVLATAGCYGIMAFGVSRRQTELAIRMVLGAGPSSVLRLVLKGGLRCVLIGAIPGLAAGLFMCRSAALRLPSLQLDPHPMWMGLLAAGLLTAVAIAACLITALRASRMNPSDILRRE